MIALALWLMASAIGARVDGPTFAQTRVPPSSAAAAPSDAEIQTAFAAIERADGYTQLVDAVRTHERVLSSVRVVALADLYLQRPDLDADQRGLLTLERQLSLDCRQYGAAAAARLLGVRLIAAMAVAADTPQQFAEVLGKFAPLAPEMSVSLVRQALDIPGAAWPAALLPAMEQLARDWPQRGALAAATRMAEAAQPGQAQALAPGGSQALTGHWRSTRIVFDSATDEHLVLQADGTAETWTVTASGRSPALRGRWRSRNGSLSVDWQDGRQWDQPFTLYQGQLVFPNVPNRRQFWERVN